MKLHAESCILHAKEFFLYFTWPLIATLLRVYYAHTRDNNTRGIHCLRQNYTHTYSSPCSAFSGRARRWMWQTFVRIVLQKVTMIFVDILMKNYASTTKNKTSGWIGMSTCIVLMQTVYSKTMLFSMRVPGTGRN